MRLSQLTGPAAICIAAAVSAAAFGAGSGKPNFVFVIADDCTY